MNDANAFREAALETLRERVGGFDSHVWGVGWPDASGAMRIDEARSDCSFGPGFLTAYNNDYSHQDVIGRLHVAFPEALKVWDLQARSRASRAMADLLDRRARHLMLCGVRRQDGLRAWISLYRHRSNDPFTRAQANAAKYAIPYLVNDWLSRMVEEGRLARVEGLDQPEPPFPSAHLTPRDLAVALSYALGYDGDELIERVRSSVATSARDAIPESKDHRSRKLEAIRRVESRVLAKLGHLSRQQFLALLRGLR